MSADVVARVVSILVSVNRPVTSEGLMFRVTPFPFDVEMFELNIVVVVPPVRTPPAPIAQDAPVAVALKLPLDWAKTRPDPSVATAKTAVNFFITWPILSLLLDTIQL